MKISKTIYSLKNRELSNLLIGRKGGRTTIMIIDKLLLKPYNANELSKILNLDYKTIVHHINIIVVLPPFLPINKFESSLLFNA